MNKNQIDPYSINIVLFNVSGFNDDLILGPVLAMFHTKRTSRAKRYVGPSTDVADRKTRYGQR